MNVKIEFSTDKFYAIEVGDGEYFLTNNLSEHLNPIVLAETKPNQICARMENTSEWYGPFDNIEEAEYVVNSIYLDIEEFEDVSSETDNSYSESQIDEYEIDIRTIH